MFEIKENGLIERRKVKYEDEFENSCIYVRYPEENRIVIKVRPTSDKRIVFDPINIYLDNSEATGCTFKYNYEKTDETITAKYLEGTKENVGQLVNHIMGLENAIRLLGISTQKMTQYLQMSDKEKEADKIQGVLKGKMNLILQYEELHQLFGECLKS